MQTERRTADEQYWLIMECRSSGLSDFQWCNEHGIKPGTFSTDYPVCGRWIMPGDITAATDIYIICGYTDMRKSIDGFYFS